MAMNNEGIIKELLKDVDFKKLTPEQITGQNGLIQQLTKQELIPTLLAGLSLVQMIQLRYFLP